MNWKDQKMRWGGVKAAEMERKSDKRQKWHREEKGERATVLIEKLFLAHKEICVKKAKHFFGEEIEQIVKQWEREEQNELIEKVFLCKMAGLVLAGLHLLIFQAIEKLSQSKYLSIQLWKQRKDNLSIALI